MKRASLLPFFAVAAIAVPFALAQEKGGGPPKAGQEKEGADKQAGKAGDSNQDQKVMREQRPSYPLTDCPISGKPIGDEPVEMVTDGKLVRLCCPKCVDVVKGDNAATIKKIDEAVVKAQKADYPMKSSVVSDAKLDDKAVDYVHGTRLVRLASAEEVEKFKKDPKSAMEKLDKAYVDAQVASYPVKKCVVSDEELGGMGEPVNYLYGTKLVRFCCKGCIKDFEKTPDKYMKALASK